MPHMSHTISPWLSRVAEKALRDGHSPGDEPESCLQNLAEKTWWAANRSCVLPPPVPQGPHVNPEKQQRDPWGEGGIAAQERKRLEEPTRVIEGLRTTALAGVTDQPPSTSWPQRS